jgi:hypothetical protein
MELPAEVMIHNEIMGIKGGRGILMQVSPEGYYEVNCVFGERAHRTFLPIAATVLIAIAPEETVRTDQEIER